MGFLGRFLGGDRSNTFSEGMVLLEEERFAEAADRFRSALQGRGEPASGSLASFHFRQALVSEGRRFLRAGQYEQAIPFFSEAVQLWDLYPDLHCLLGTAQGLNGDWEEGLLAARTALRLNPDYVEARLLEGVALEQQDRLHEASKSLDSLIEVGRRVDHWLIASLGREGNFCPDDLPDNLLELLEEAVSGRSEKEEVAAAVAQCRAGNWEEGLARFEVLVQKRPRYPDYRTRHAAAFFQLGRNEEALAEVDAALALNENYRTAIDLKGLILADSQQIIDARDFLRDADVHKDSGHRDGGSEDLFGAYLRGVLNLLTGDLKGVTSIFEEYPGLVRDFARAELLLAAADDLLDRGSLCGRRLASLANEWPGEAVYSFLLACHQLENRRYQDVSGVLGNWPANGDNDTRPLYLQNVLACAQGRCTKVDPPTEDDERIEGAAWEFLTAKAAFHQKDYAECWSICSRLVDSDYLTERVLSLMMMAAEKGGREIGQDWDPPSLIPESCLPQAVFLYFGRKEEPKARKLLDRQRAVHPEDLTGYWLSPGFWLDPIRTWIG
ncbi:MAG: hypothetical protein KOO60_02435 [Gemmatimonadales bacterium]|nr:hypothetical protein [Gemmatimonadales bacterium]